MTKFIITIAEKEVALNTWYNEMGKLDKEHAANYKVFRSRILRKYFDRKVLEADPDLTWKTRAFPYDDELVFELDDDLLEIEMQYLNDNKKFVHYYTEANSKKTK